MEAHSRLWSLELVACAYMTGLILLIHFVHYPSFEWIRNSEFKAFSKFHSRVITPIVFPAMAVELGAAIALIYLNLTLVTALNFASVLALWLITGLKSAPTHEQLATQGFTVSLHLSLMRWNRVRALIWCARLVGLFLVRVF